MSPAGADRSPVDANAPGSAPAQRLDKWLWFVRAIKTRTQAAQLVTEGKVRLNRQRVEKPSQTVRPGDVVTVTVRGHVRILKVVASGERRGPAAEACTLYEDLTPPPPPRPEADPHASRPAGSGRPTKKERRQTDRLKED